jgi:hypothetical protein
MMTMEDKSLQMLINAVGASLNTEIKIFISCEMRKKSNNDEIKTKRIIFCAGQNLIYIFNHSFDSLKFSFSIGDIEQIIIDKNSNTSILLIIKSDVYYKEKKVPYIYLILDNRDIVVKKLMVIYSTYYAFNYGKVSDLKIEHKEIKFSERFTLQKKLALYHRPPENYRIVCFKDH